MIEGKVISIGTAMCSKCNELRKYYRYRSEDFQVEHGFMEKIWYCVSCYTMLDSSKNKLSHIARNPLP